LGNAIASGISTGIGQMLVATARSVSNDIVAS
jgi:hypothetical protein